MAGVIVETEICRDVLSAHWRTKKPSEIIQVQWLEKRGRGQRKWKRGDGCNPQNLKAREPGALICESKRRQMSKLKMKQQNAHVPLFSPFTPPVH